MLISRLVKTFAAAAIALPLFAVPASAQNNASNASAVSALSGLLVVSGTVFLVDKGSEAVVSGVTKVGESVVVTLRTAGTSASEAGASSIQFSGRAARELTLSVGQSIKVVSESTGWALYGSAALIAFIPNEIGKSLIHQSRVQ